MLFQKKGDRVLLASGVKGVDNIKAGDWIREVAPVVGGVGEVEPTLPKLVERIPQKLKRLKKKLWGI